MAQTNSKRLHIGPLLLSRLRPRSWSIHYRHRRLLWVRDSREHPLLFSERHADQVPGMHMRLVGPWVIHWWERETITAAHPPQPGDNYAEARGD